MSQRIKLATELQRLQRGDTLYVLDEPTTGLHPSDVDKLMAQLDGLVEAGNTVIVVEHEMKVVAASDWVIDIGPGAGDEGGQIVAAGPPSEVATAAKSRTAGYLARFLDCSYECANALIWSDERSPMNQRVIASHRNLSKRTHKET